MEYCNLGTSGLRVSRVCLGVMSIGSPAWRPWILSEEQGAPIIRKALDLGITFFDTSDMYSNGESERALGNILRGAIRREEAVIATKVFFRTGPGENEQGLSRKHIFDAIEGSLKRLGTEYVDLYQIHRWDYRTPIGETMEALHDVVKSGKARYIGASSMFAYQLASAQETARRNGWTRFISMQNHYNLVYREEEREMIPLCRQEGMGLIPWSPLARGFLAGNRTKDRSGDTLRSKSDDFAFKLYYADADFRIVERVQELARRRACKPTQIALAWLLQRPGVAAPIIGATTVGHVEDAVASLGVVLSGEECAFLEELYSPHPILGHS